MKPTKVIALKSNQIIAKSTNTYTYRYEITAGKVR